MASCPYCFAETHADALVCPTCRRELFLVRQLQKRVAELEEKVASLDAHVAEAPPITADPTATTAAPTPRETDWKPVIAACLTPLLLLLLAHWLTLFVYDAKVLYLRLFAIAIPLPFGFLFGRAAAFGFSWKLLTAFAMALAAVFGMSGITGWLDQSPILPQNMAETREFIEFAASIGLSFTTGLWLQQWVANRTDVARSVAPLLKDKSKALTTSISRANDFGSALVALCTTAISIYTGLKSVLGN